MWDYVTDENTKIRAIAKEGVINRGIITDLLLCMPSEATTFDFNVSHVRHSRNYITIPLCDAHHGGEMRHASVPAALKNAWR